MAKRGKGRRRSGGGPGKDRRDAEGDAGPPRGREEDFDRRRIERHSSWSNRLQSRERREAKLRSARIKLGMYRKKVGKGNYPKLGPVVNHVKECVRGVSKYFKVDYEKGEGGRITIDWEEKKEKVEEARGLDGRFALMSSDLGMDCREIVDAYFEKSEIERSFRCLKQIVEIHPTRHWLENRVRVHVFICYTAYLLLRVMEYKLCEKGMKITAEAALEELGKIKQGALIDPTTEYHVIKVARLSKHQEKLVKCLGLSGYINSET